MLVLVTGARGAIGRHVVALALSRGHRVIGVGYGDWQEEPEFPRIGRWINGAIDVENLSALASLEGKPDAIVHLAGGSLVSASVERPSEDFRRTVESAERLLEWLRSSAPNSRLVIASSAAVYGNGFKTAICESEVLAPTSPYGCHKSMVEIMARSLARQYELPVSVLRLFSVYGPGLRKQLIWDVARRRFRGERTITLAGSGNEQRDFLYIADAASMLLDLIPLADPTAPIINGGTGRATSVAEVTRLVMSHFDGGAVHFSGKSRAGDPDYLVSDVRKARSAGLAAATPLENGVARTVQWIGQAS